MSPYDKIVLSKNALTTVDPMDDDMRALLQRNRERNRKRREEEAARKAGETPAEPKPE
jgi:hypothetical protein